MLWFTPKGQIAARHDNRVAYLPLVLTHPIFSTTPLHLCCKHQYRFHLQFVGDYRIMLLIRDAALLEACFVKIKDSFSLFQKDMLKCENL